MSCIQNLNDMWDTLEANIEASAGRSMMNGLDVKVPFRSQYDLSCFLKATPNKRSDQSDEASEPVMTKRAYVINIPSDFCKKQSISQKVFTAGIERILEQQGLMFQLAGLDNPWQSATVATADSDDDDDDDSNNKQQTLSSELEILLFEKWMGKNSLAAAVGQVDRHGRSGLSKVLSTTMNRTIAANEDRVFGGRNVSLSYYEDHVDAYIKVMLAMLVRMVRK